MTNYVNNEFVSNIKQWVEYDNKINTLNKELKHLREERNKTAETISQYIEVNNLKKTRFNLNDGYIKYSKTYQTPPLTMKYISQSLKEFLQEDELVADICEYIKSRRKKTEIKTIKRTLSKNKSHTI